MSFYFTHLGSHCQLGSILDDYQGINSKLVVDFLLEFSVVLWQTFVGEATCLLRRH